MKILALGGAGAMGTVTVRDLTESPDVSTVIVGDVSIERANQLKRLVGSEKLSVRRVDVSNRAGLVEAMKEADAVANATPYHLNIQTMKAAMEAGKNLTDLGGVYYTTLKQLELNEEAKEAGITVVLGCGLAPGITDILAKYGADKLDAVDEVHIKYGEVNLTPAKYKWSFRTVLEEYTTGPVVYQNGEYRKLPPFSGKQIVKFPEPIGERTCCYGLYSGVATLPRTIGKGVKVVDCLMVHREEDEQRIKVLNEMGLTGNKAINFKGVKVSPREFLLRCAPPPDARAKDVAGAIVEVIGEKGGEKARCIYSLVHPYHEKYGVSALAYLTGVPLSIVSQMLAKGEIPQLGVLPPEVSVKPEPFFAELAKRGIKINETIETTRTL
ncbi:MAG: saccharopine dehydrogenase family protein [Candidatus Bathyarchaeia archaeon]